MPDTTFADEFAAAIATTASVDALNEVGGIEAAVLVGPAKAQVDKARAKAIVLSGTDLFHPFDPDVAYGQYIVETTGALTNGSGFNATGFIPASAGDQIVGPGPVMNARRAYYDINKLFLSGVNNGGAGALTVPNDPAIAFVRFSVPVANWDSLKLESKASQNVYTPYAERSNQGDQMQLHFLRQTASRLAMIAFGYSTQIIINLIGDSYLHAADRSAKDFTAALVAKYGDAGGGWCGAGFLAGGTAPWTVSNQPIYLNGNVRPATYPTRLLGSQTSTYYTSPMCDMAVVTLAVGETFFQAFPALPVHNGCDMHFIGASGASVNVAYGTYNGSGNVADPANYTWGSSTNYSTAGTVGATQVTDIKAGIPSGAGAVRIVGAAGTTQLGGVNLKSAANGVRVNKLAATGSNNTSWATQMATAGYQTSFQNLGAHLNIQMDGPNSQGGLNYQTWGGNENNIWSRIKAMTPYTDCLMVIPPENARTTNSFTIAGYENIGRNIAVAARVTFAVIRFGDAGNTAEYKSTGPVTLLNPDDLHPSVPSGGAPSGGAVIASRLLSLIVPTWA